MAAALLAMNEVFLDGASRQPDRAISNRRPTPPPHAQRSVLFDDQLFSSAEPPSPDGLRAIAARTDLRSDRQSNPFNPKAQRDELGETWALESRARRPSH